MPSTSKKQQRFMGAKLGEQRETGHNSTGMNESQLSDFARDVKHTHKKRDVPGQSLVDVESFEETRHVGSVKARIRASDPRLGNNGEPQRGDPIPVKFLGPDTAYESLELDPSCYGHDWNPMPYTTLQDPTDKAPWRRIEQFEDESSRKMGAQADRFEHQRRYARDVDPEVKVDQGDMSYTPYEADTDETYGTTKRSVKY